MGTHEAVASQFVNSCLLLTTAFSRSRQVGATFEIALENDFVCQDVAVHSDLCLNS